MDSTASYHRWLILALRFACVVSMAIWFGGFTFYSAVVVPVLHDELESLQAGGITQRVTDTLNLIGLVAIACWWLDALAERSAGWPRVRFALYGCLAISTLTLACQLIMHRVMDERLAGGSLHNFYPLHEKYLIASTVQWAANLATIGGWMIFWRFSDNNHKIALN